MTTPSGPTATGLTATAPPVTGPTVTAPMATGPTANTPEATPPPAAAPPVAAPAPAGTELADPAAGLPSLSPSRAADFKTCPLLYRFRSIDRLPETPSAEQVRGTLVHAVLERLFDLPAHERTPQAAEALVEPQWQWLLEQEPALATALPEGAEPLLASTGPLLAGYFAVEDPRRLEPSERESLIEAVVETADAGGALRLRGYVDRLDTSPAGELRVVDYKSGGAPREAFEARALFQLKFYALVLWRTRGRVPAVLRLLYLKDAEICDYRPEAEELRRFERTLLALWRAIDRATAARDFRPKPSRLCDWCSHQALCPEFGGTPPPFPEPPVAAVPRPAEPRSGEDV